MKPFEFAVIESARQAPYWICEVKGYLDAHTSIEFEVELERVLDQQVTRLIIDFSQLNYISSSGIGCLMSLAQKLGQDDGALVLLAPSEKVYNILEMLGFTKVFKIAASEEELANWPMLERSVKSAPGHRDNQAFERLRRSRKARTAFMVGGDDKRREEVLVDFSWPADGDRLREIREQVCAVIHDHGASPEELTSIEISLDEACANVVRHAYEANPEPGALDPKGAGRIIDVRLALGDDQVRIEVTDDGVGPAGGPHQGVGSINDYLSAEPPGGLGYYIISQLMDDYCLSFPPGRGTRISMTKRISRSA